MEKISMADIDVQKINPLHKPLLVSFKSYEKELVDFLVEDAMDNQVKSISITYLWFYKPTSELIAYISVLTDAINLQGNLKDSFRKSGITYKSLPALKIGRLCVSDTYLRRGIGTLMVEFAIILAERIRKDAGLRFITTDAKRNSAHDSIHFYRKLGFEVLREREKGTLPMYKDLIKK